MVLKQLHPIEKRETALKTVDPIVNPGWDAFICAHPEGTIFHHSSWARVLAETYGDSYEYYILEDENGHITGALPLWHFNNALSGNRLVCLPHSDHCYPLVSDEKDYEALLAGPLQNIESNRASSLEIRGWSSLGQPENCRLQSGHFHLVHIADLDKNPDEIIGDMTRNGRYNLRYAAKNPLAVRLGQDERDLRTLHRFHAQASARHGKTPVALSFLRSIYRNVISAGYGYLFIAELAGSIAAVNLYMCFNGTAFCMFSAQDTERAEYRANYYLHWKAMEYFHNRGYHSYHFGGTDLIAPNLAFFKRCMGAKESFRCFYYYPDEVDYYSIPRNGVYRLAGQALKVFPPPIKSLAGRLIDRYFR